MKFKSKNNIDIEEEFFHDLKHDSTPNQNFKSSLKRKLISNLDDNPAILNFNFKFMHAKKRIALAGGVFLSMFLFAAVGVGIFVAYNRPQPSDKSAAEIFAAMLSANPGGSGAEQSTFADQRMAVDSLLVPAQDKTFSTSTSISQKGPRSSACTVYAPYDLDYSESESISYYSQEHGNFGKYITVDKDGQIYTYSLSLKDSYYEYYGGSFAVKTPAANYSILETRDAAGSEDTTSSSPVSDNPGDSTGSDPELKPEDYFGPDATLIGDEVIDGRNHHVVSWSYDTFCEGETSRKVFSKVWVDAENFSYSKEEVYVDSITPENLVVRNTYKNETGTREFSEVQNLFTFDLDVQVRDVNPNENAIGTQGYTNALRTMLSEQKLSVLVPADSGFVMNSYYSNKLNLPDPYSYRLERSFYRDDEAGTKMFNEAQNLFRLDNSQQAFFSASYNKAEGEKYLVFSFEVYGSDVTDAQMKEKVYATESTKVNLKIGGTNVQFDLYDLSVGAEIDKREEGAGSSDSTEPMPADCPDCGKSFVAIGTIGTHKYLIRFDGGFSLETVQSMVINSLNAGTANGLNQAMDLISKVEVIDPIIAL